MLFTKTLVGGSQMPLPIITSSKCLHVFSYLFALNKDYTKSSQKCEV